ncbi:MAG TPA: ParB/RepB/Spo0J family partition protein [Phaeodactylibacter sp.]|nr:ParB/RepB/Spo0J family partition protein [Phaeodactylibacter sp.]
MSKKIKKRDLGKGLGALLSNINTDLNSAASDEAQDITSEMNATGVAMIPVSAIGVNPWQPRSEFEQEALHQLCESIKIHGLIQPVTVRRLDANTYQLISGERRIRAAKLADLAEVPAYIRTANDQEMLEMALVENIQRADLNPLEVAITYRRLKDECNLGDAQLAERVAKKRSTITNYLRLLDLPPNIQNAIRSKEITLSHAKALAGLSDILAQTEAFKRVIEQRLSVRATEALVASYQNPKKKSTGSAPADAHMSAAYREIQDNLCKWLDTKVNLKRKSNGKGQIVINFNDDGDLNRLLEYLEKDNF